MPRSCPVRAEPRPSASRARQQPQPHAAGRHRRTGNSAKSRGSIPRITDTSLMAPARETAASRRMPSAIATGVRSSLAASLAIAASARAAVERDLAAERLVRAEPPEQYVRIRHGRLRSAAAVARGAGPGARRARPDREELAGCQRRDASAADPDRVDVDLADLDRECADTAFGRHGEFAATHEADVSRRPADVAGDQVRILRGRTDEARRDHATGGTG